MSHNLSQAELIVLVYAANGFSVPETAKALYKGTETVKTQRNRIILKLAARNITDAVVKSIRAGIIDPHTEVTPASELYGLAA